MAGTPETKDEHYEKARDLLMKADQCVPDAMQGLGLMAQAWIMLGDRIKPAIPPPPPPVRTPLPDPTIPERI